MSSKLIKQWIVRYTSASLANTVPSSAFKDVDGKPTAPERFTSSTTTV